MRWCSKIAFYAIPQKLIENVLCETKGREKKKIFLKATFKELHEYVCIIVMHIPFTF